VVKISKDLERHAGDIYTYAIFYKFQDEFWNACVNCEVEDIQVIDESVVIAVVDNTRNMAKKRQVIYNPSNHVAHCSCKMFECEAISYCQIWCVLKGESLCELSTYYILNQWIKMSASKPILDVDDTLSRDTLKWSMKIS